jgi:hypothetical protein
MCGSSSGQKQISAEQRGFFQQLQQSYQVEFGGQQAILNSLNQAFQPILQAGPDQQGFGPQERAALGTQIAEGTGGAYAKAAQRLNLTQGAQGGGNELLPSGATAQLNEQLASQAAQTMSNQELGETAANYAQGRANFGAAAGALSSAAGMYNPASFAGQATGAGSAAFSSATQMQQQGQQWIGALGGALGGAVSTVSGGLAGSLGSELSRVGSGDIGW